MIEYETIKSRAFTLGTNQTIIEINGTRYDAATGRPILNAPKTMDGVVRTHPANSPSTTKPLATAPKIAAKHETTNQAPKIMSGVVHSSHQQRAKTLMRKAVKKPSAYRTAPPVTIHPLTTDSISPKAGAIPESRMHLAQNTKTHTSVRRFDIAPSHVQPKTMPMKVAVAPYRTQAAPSTLSEPVVKPTQQITASERFISSQLARGASHEIELPPKKLTFKKRVKSWNKSKKVVSGLTSAAAVLALGAFFVMQSMPAITIAMASKKAGISARLPKGIPSNFAFDRTVNASPGQVTIAFSSRTDSRHFSLTQRASDSTVDSLRQDIQDRSKGQFQTYESNGLTLFLSNSGQADWLDKGVRYNLSGNSGLSTEQVATIASSL